MMLVYLGLLLLGGGVIGMQLVLGHDAEGAEVEVDAHGDVDHGEAFGAAALFLSLRFWSFACLAAGLCGTLCMLLGVLSGWPLALLSTALGLASGAATTFALRALVRGSPVSSLEESGVVGQLGRVLLPPRGQAPGKVRLMVAGHITDLLAVSDDQTLAAGDEVLVLALKGAQVEVARVDPLLLAGRSDRGPSA